MTSKVDTGAAPPGTETVYESEVVAIDQLRPDPATARLTRACLLVGGW